MPVAAGDGMGILSQCTYRCVVLPDDYLREKGGDSLGKSQCTYRCVVLPDGMFNLYRLSVEKVSMHLQVRGAP